jgi:hypothetical protein
LVAVYDVYTERFPAVVCAVPVAVDILRDRRSSAMARGIVQFVAK